MSSLCDYSELVHVARLSKVDRIHVEAQVKGWDLLQNVARMLHLVVDINKSFNTGL